MVSCSHEVTEQEETFDSHAFIRAKRNKKGQTK